jgi:hypothetical protein
VITKFFPTTLYEQTIVNKYFAHFAYEDLYLEFTPTHIYVGSKNISDNGGTERNIRIIASDVDDLINQMIGALNKAVGPDWYLDVKI